MEATEIVKQNSASLTIAERSWKICLAQNLDAIAMTTGTALVSGQSRVWESLLKGYSENELREAFFEHQRRSPFFPKPPEIIKLVAEVNERRYHEKQRLEHEQAMAECRSIRAARAAWDATEEGQAFAAEMARRTLELDDHINLNVTIIQSQNRRHELLKQSRALREIGRKGGCQHRDAIATRSNSDAFVGA